MQKYENTAEARIDQPEPIALLYQKYNRILKIFLRSRVNCEHLAEEMAQEVFLRFSKREDQTAIENAKAYLFTMARNISTDHLRRKNLKVIDETASLDEQRLRSPMATPEEIASCRQTQKTLDCALAKLPLMTRRVFCYRRYDGLAIAEIARLLNVSERMIYKRMEEAMKHLTISFREIR